MPQEAKKLTLKKKRQMCFEYLKTIKEFPHYENLHHFDESLEICEKFLKGRKHDIEKLKLLSNQLRHEPDCRKVISVRGGNSVLKAAICSFLNAVIGFSEKNDLDFRFYYQSGLYKLQKVYDGDIQANLYREMVIRSFENDPDWQSPT